MQEFASIESDDPIESLRSRFQRAGIAEPEPVARLCADGLAPCRENRWHDDFVDAVVDRLERHHDSWSDGGVLLLTVLAAIEERDSMLFKEDVELFEDVVRRLLDHLSGLGADLTAAFVAATRSSGVARAMLTSGLSKELLDRGLLAPLRLIDRVTLRTLRAGKGGRHFERHYQHDPTRLEYWCDVELSSVVPVCVSMVEQEELATLGALARGIGVALSLSYTYLPPIDVGQLARILCRRRRVEGGTNDSVLTSACWNFAADLAGDASKALPDDYAELSGAAFAALGRMRTLFQADDAAEQFRAAHDDLDAAMFFVLRTQPDASIWDVLRRLLLAMRSLPAPGVPSDLRTWSEPGKEPLPAPWGWVPEHIARVLELYLKRELELDPELKALRVRFARFCLDRVKSKKAETDGASLEMVDPDPHWRMGYILAARELHAALGARGHRVLVWSKNHDPEQRVREAAALAEDVVRREQALPPNKSPRRAVFAAFWWLRQAHVLALGGSVDEVGARETFQKEVRRQARS